LWEKGKDCFMQEGREETETAMASQVDSSREQALHTVGAQW